MRTTDCLKCNFPRDEPKGERVCKKCGRLESQPKGSVHRGSITIVGQTDVQAVVLDPLAAFLPPPSVEPQPDPPAYVQGVTAAVAAIERAAAPLSAPSNTAAPGVTNEGATPAATAAAPPAGSLAEYSADPPTVAGGDTLPAGAASPASPSASTLSAPIAESEKPQRGHSPFGGSRAKQFMNCTGSTALIQQLAVDPEETEYSLEGTQAHALAALCLENDVEAWATLTSEADKYPLVKLEDAPYVQAYVDYVRSRPGHRQFEKGFHRPELHELYWGSIDAELIPVAGVQLHVLEIVDFKFGAGVFVPVERNEQMMYYAAGTIMEDPDFYPDEGVVRLTVAQPRITWAENPIRSWDTTVGEIKRWLHEECLPAMNVRMQDLVLSLGPWCQFCPAKLVCRAMTELYKRFSQPGDEPLAMGDEALGTEFANVAYVKMRIKAVEQEVLRRLMDGKAVPLTQLERAKTERVWKPDAPVVISFPGAAYEEPKLKSPAQIEKLPGGKEFVATYAYTPEGGLKAAVAGSGKPAVVIAPPEERYAGAAAALFANKTA